MPSAKMLDLSRPPVFSSPLPSSKWAPNPSLVSPRATPASAWVLTMLARNFAKSPSERSGWLW
ncbi:Uncharacterised protein [Mycobacteroides abscessus subsp. abscessus]|nr:Uncharacterised protein [Mycobacteroides abscessus subsp. abscessus]